MPDACQYQQCDPGSSLAGRGSAHIVYTVDGEEEKASNNSDLHGNKSNTDDRLQDVKQEKHGHRNGPVTKNVDGDKEIEEKADGKGDMDERDGGAKVFCQGWSAAIQTSKAHKGVGQLESSPTQLRVAKRLWDRLAVGEAHVEILHGVPAAG
ncbi:hypothetical protein SEPCBS57363_004846 [Sporothrix epigloea]|uniref:Uncharacterized protein n=1 Tax=Sporothrix epigloea TaxID=1892477 RepID=A0ABP0DY15_9PEZI